MNPCPYYDDGNPNMYTKQAMEERNKLKTNPLVKEAINDFMNEFQRNNLGHCSKEEYFKIFMKIGTILRPSIDADELQKLVREDFEMDSMDKFVPPNIEKTDDEKEDLKKAEAAQQEFEQQQQKQYDYLDE